MAGWKRLSCSESKTELLVRLLVLENGSSYEITFCDLTNAWRERLTAPEVEERCKEFNRRLEAPSETILQHIQQSIMQHSAKNLSLITQDSEIIKLELRNSFGGGIPFVWVFNCKKLNAKDCIDAFLSPMLKLVSSLQYANDQLIKLIGKKDLEIRDYKDSGAKISRRHVETSEFDQREFMQDMRCRIDYRGAIGKDVFSIATDDAISKYLHDVETDLQSPLPAGNSSMAGSPSKSPRAKVVGQVSNRRRRNNRKAPEGVKVISDSENESNDEGIAPNPTIKRTVAAEQNTAAKRKKTDKRKKLF